MPTGLTVALNNTLAAAANGAVVADAFTALRNATAVSGGKTCWAGLLNGSSPQPVPTKADPFTCDVHPSLTGQRLLAKTVAAAYRAARSSDD